MSVKQVIVLRKDLNMRKGKCVAQGAHASLKVFFDKMTVSGNEAKFQINTQQELDWINGSFTKVTLSVMSEEELLDLYQKAKDSKFLCSLVQDLGKTEFKGVPTYTALAIGPEDSEEIDKITGGLPLL